MIGGWPILDLHLPGGEGVPSVRLFHVSYQVVVLFNGAQARNVFWQVGTPRTVDGIPLAGDASFPAATGSA